jgi:hypothetical protein
MLAMPQRAWSSLRETLVERVNAAAAGALLLALDSMNILTNATLLERLESTPPGPAFFAT